MPKAKPRSLIRRGLIALLKLALVAAVIGVVGLFYLDAQVRDRLAERLWQAPAQVYARPLHLYAEMPLRPDDLARELKLLGYRNGDALRQPGDMVRSGNKFQVFLRGFQFDDGPQGARKVQLWLSERHLVDLRDDAGRSLDLVKVEPLMLGTAFAGRTEARVLVQLDEVPRELIDTLLLVEDRSFFSHWGISLRSVGRALVANIQAGRTVQGGSTLTQQLIKNVYLDSDRNLGRKVIEAAMALLAELHYDKETLLEAYLNEVYLGQEGPRAIHGFALAARHYFNRPLTELRSEQIALLVGMVKGPSQYDPWRNPERALQRRNLVLGLMAQHELLPPAQLATVRARPLGLTKASASDGLFPAYLDLVRRQLQRDYDEAALRERGLRIFTAFDPQLQWHAERALTATLDSVDPKQSGLESAMIVTDVVSGDVVALIGGRRHRYAGFNRALDAVRPIGSLVKPAVFLAALEQPQRYTLMTLLDDTPLSVKGPNGKIWTPANYDKRFHGPTPLYRALAESYNVATARLGMEVGLPAVLEVLKRLGVSRPMPAVPALTLGVGELSPFEVAMMYQTIAADGTRVGLRSIRTITAPNGLPLARYPQEPRQAVDPASVHLLQYAMREVMRSGTGRAALGQLPDLPVAGKSGTTDQLRDSWFAGFAGDYLAVVWMGRDDNRPAGLTGSGGALKAWLGFMKAASRVPLALEPGPGINAVWVDERDGALTQNFCEGAKLVPFASGSEPTVRGGCAPDLGEPVKRAFQWVRDLF